MHPKLPRGIFSDAGDEPRSELGEAVLRSELEGFTSQPSDRPGLGRLAGVLEQVRQAHLRVKRLRVLRPQLRGAPRNHRGVQRPGLGRLAGVHEQDRKVKLRIQRGRVLQPQLRGELRNRRGEQRPGLGCLAGPLEQVRLVDLRRQRCMLGTANER